MTLQLRDPAGSPVDLDVGARRPLVVGVATTDDLATTLRRAVHADLVRRAAELHRAVVTVVAVGVPAAELTAALAAYNCRPFGDGDPAVVVGADVLPPYDGAPLDLSGDPLATRLALLGRTGVVGVVAELARWRQQVAAWAESPSKPMCADYVGWCHEAVDDDLDTPRLLALMREVEAHPELPPGSKFETFAHLDSLVGLDLARDVGVAR